MRCFLCVTCWTVCCRHTSHLFRSVYFNILQYTTIPSPLYTTVYHNTITIVYYSILQYTTITSPLYTTVFYCTGYHLHCILKYSIVYHNTISTVCYNAITGITYTGGNIRSVPQPQWDRTADIAQESYGLLVTHPGKVSQVVGLPLHMTPLENRVLVFLILNLMLLMSLQSPACIRVDRLEFSKVVLCIYRTHWVKVPLRGVVSCHVIITCSSNKPQLYIVYPFP